MEKTRKRGLHEHAAYSYLTHEFDNLRARAFHLDQAGLVNEAAKAYRLAGEQNLARFAFYEAQISLDRALTLMTKTPSIERTETLLALAQASNSTGDRDRQELALKEALVGAQGNPQLLLQTLLSAGGFSYQTGQNAELKKQLQSALALAKSLKDKIQEAKALLLLAELSREQSLWSDAQKYYDQALVLARATYQMH